MTCLIIGSGKRVEDTLIPALNIVGEQTYLFSRNYEKREYLCSRYKLECLKELSNLPKDVTKVFIAIPNTEFLYYVKILSRMSLKQAELFIETPIIGGLDNFQIFKYSKYFKDILVCEDWISKPFFNILRILQEQKRLGSIKPVSFKNSGFSYHALAVTRNLLNYGRLIYGRVTKVNHGEKILFMRFLDNSMSLNYPIDYLKGEIEVTFDRGVVVYSPDGKQQKIREKINHAKGIMNSVFIVNPIVSSKKIVSYHVNGKEFDFSDSETSRMIISQLASLEIKNNSIENQEKIISMALKLLNKDGQKYNLYEGTYDSFVIAFMNKFNFFFDVPIIGHSLVFSFLKLAKTL